MIVALLHMGVSENRDTPKWTVYNGTLIKMDDLGVPLFSETPTWQEQFYVYIFYIIFIK